MCTEVGCFTLQCSLLVLCAAQGLDLALIKSSVVCVCWKIDSFMEITECV